MHPCRTWVWALAGILACAETDLVTNSSDLAYDEEVTSIVLHNREGNVVVTPGGSQIEVERTVTYSGVPPQLFAFADGGVLSLDDGCWESQLRCRIDYEIRSPRALELVVENGTGEISVRGVLGDSALTTGSGGIEVGDATGRLTLETGAGAIALTRARLDELSAASALGTIDVALFDVPQSVRLTTDLGNLSLAVPPGTYRVDADNGGTGPVVVSGLIADEGASSLLQLTSGSGTIEVVGR